MPTAHLRDKKMGGGFSRKLAHVLIATGIKNFPFPQYLLHLHLCGSL